MSEHAAAAAADNDDYDDDDDDRFCRFSKPARSWSDWGGTSAYIVNVPRLYNRFDDYFESSSLTLFVLTLKWSKVSK